MPTGSGDRCSWCDCRLAAVEGTQQNEVDRQYDCHEYCGRCRAKSSIIDHKDLLIDEHSEHLRGSAAENGGRHE